MTSSYVLVETYALLQNRLGLEAVGAFREDFAPLMDVLWVNETIHERALDDLIARASRKVSLVDATSFALMREHGIDQAFAFDDDFVNEGFAT